MAQQKEAVAIVLDVGPHMNEPADQQTTCLQASINAINMILQRKLFAESKDEVALILFGTEDTANELADNTSYQNISVARPLGPVDWDLLQYIHNQIQPSNTAADFLDSFVVAMDHLTKSVQGKRGFGAKRLILFSNLAGPFGDDQLKDIIGGMKEIDMELNIIGPDLDDEDNKPGASAANYDPKMAQKEAGKTMLRYILERVEGEWYSFNEALDALSYFQSRQVRPTAWKCLLEIGSTLKIPIAGYIRTKAAKNKSFKNVMAKARSFQKARDAAKPREKMVYLDSEADQEPLTVDLSDAEEPSAIDKPPELVQALGLGVALKLEEAHDMTKEAKAKSFKNVNAREPDADIQRLRTFHLNDDEETEIEEPQTVVGHRYGNTLVPFSKDDLDVMKFRAEKCFKVLGFTSSANVHRSQFLGDSSMVVVADKGDEAAALALSSLINALLETDSVAIVRRVYSASSSPRLGCLVPHIKAKYEYLVYTELPFAEDVRQFTFGSLPVRDISEDINKKYIPSNKQLDVIDQLIDTMDLNKNECEDKFKPKGTFNPHLQRLYQCMQHRVFSPNEPLPPLNALIANTLQLPVQVAVASEPVLKKIAKIFPLKEIERKANQENVFGKRSNENGDEAGPSKRSKLDDDLRGGMADLGKSKVKEVGTVNPVEDFNALLADKEQDRFDQACQMMGQRIELIVRDSFGDQFYAKAMDCLKALRDQCIRNAEPIVYNDFIRKFKQKLEEMKRKDFWKKIADNDQGLISKLESEESAVTVDEARGFLKDKASEARPAPAPAPQEDLDDLMDQF